MPQLSEKVSGKADVIVRDKLRTHLRLELIPGGWKIVSLNECVPPYSGGSSQECLQVHDIVLFDNYSTGTA